MLRQLQHSFSNNGFANHTQQAFKFLNLGMAIAEVIYSRSG